MSTSGWRGPSFATLWIIFGGSGLFGPTNSTVAPSAKRATVIRVDHIIRGNTGKSEDSGRVGLRSCAYADSPTVGVDLPMIGLPSTTLTTLPSMRAANRPRAPCTTSLSGARGGNGTFCFFASPLMSAICPANLFLVHGMNRFLQAQDQKRSSRMSLRSDFFRSSGPAASEVAD